MSKKSLANRMSGITGKPVSECLGLVDSLFKAIRAETHDKNRLVIKGFGSFIVQTTGKRNGRNPSTGENLIIQGKRKVKFKPNANFFPKS
jgi:nucleoid DNA-binding protein